MTESAPTLGQNLGVVIVVDCCFTGVIEVKGWLQSDRLIDRGDLELVMDDCRCHAGDIVLAVNRRTDEVITWQGLSDDERSLMARMAREYRIPSRFA